MFSPNSFVESWLGTLSAERRFARPRFEVRGDVTIDGESVEDVGIQLRGGLGSFQRYADKPQWALDFNALVPGRRFHGLEGLLLNNANEDPSYLADLAGMEVYRIAGSPYARVGYAQLFVNGEDKGLMVVVEPTDDRWLVRSFGGREGNLYDGTYVFNGWSPYFLDVGEGRDAAFDLKEGEDVGSADIAAISAAVEAVRAGAPLSRVASVVDLERLSAMLAAEWFIGAAGRDDAFWDRPTGNLADLCFAEADCAADQQRRRDVLPAAIEAAGLPDALVTVRERIRAAAEQDPLGVCDATRVASAQDALLAWFGR